MASARGKGSGWFRGLFLTALLVSCSNKMDPKDCGKLRESAFDLINRPSSCNGSADCRPSEWPDCPKAVNQQTFEAIGKLHDSAQKGKCEEPPKRTCPPTPPLECQEGLCAFRYKGAPPAAAGEVRFE